MLRRYWMWGAVLATSSVLVVGCASAPGRKPALQGGDGRAASVKRERVADQSVERLSKAHAHYSAGVIHEMEGQPGAAAEEYYQAALLDPDEVHTEAIAKLELGKRNKLRAPSPPH